MHQFRSQSGFLGSLVPHLHPNDTYFISLHLAGWTPIWTPGMIWDGDSLESVLLSGSALRRVTPTHILDVGFCA